MKKHIQFILIAIFQIIPIISIAQTAMPRPLATLPEIIEGKATAGKLTNETLPAYKGTAVHHSIYLPRDYHTSGPSFPLIVELTGNKWAPCGSTGKVENAHLGYSLTLGFGAVVVSVPYVSPDGRPWYVSFKGSKEDYILPLKAMGVEHTAAYVFAAIPMSKRFPIIPNKVFMHEHNDCWPLFDIPEAAKAREWVKNVLKM